MSTYRQNLKWEVVGKNMKKSKSQMKGNSPKHKKVKAEDMPTITPSDPLEHDSTLFEIFSERTASSRPFAPIEKRPLPDVPATGTSGAGAKKKASYKKSLFSALNEMEVDHIQNIVTLHEDRFPSNPEIWLKELVSCLNSGLRQVPEQDMSMDNVLTDYPLCKVPRKMKELLVETLNQCSDSTWTEFYVYCLQKMVDEISRGISTHGYRICLQYIAFEKPILVTRNIKMLRDMLAPLVAKHPLRCAALLWAVGQVGYNSLKCGLLVWYHLMLPVLKVRQLASIPIEYLEALFSRHKEGNLKDDAGVVGGNSNRSAAAAAATSISSSVAGTIDMSEYFVIFDVVFDRALSLPANFHKRLILLFRKIKMLTFQCDPHAILHEFFPQFLTRMSSNTRLYGQLKNELLSSLLFCLSHDKRTIGIWAQLYSRHIFASSQLLEHMLVKWPVVSKDINQDALKDGLTKFMRANNAGLKAGPSSGDETWYALSAQYCQDIKEKLRQGRRSGGIFSWKGLVVIGAIFILGAGFLTYDIATATNRGGGGGGDFKDSRLGSLLDSFGLLPVCLNAAAFVNSYWTHSKNLLEANFPHVCEFCVVLYGHITSTLIVVYRGLATATNQLLLLADQAITSLLETVENKWPGLLPRFFTALSQLTDRLLQLTIFLLQTIFYFAIDFCRSAFQLLTTPSQWPSYNEMVVQFWKYSMILHDYIMYMIENILQFNISLLTRISSLVLHSK